MKLTRGLVSLTIIFSVGFISFLSLSALTVTAQESNLAVQRGYRTGYSDGYMAGYRDSLDGAAKGYARHAEYESANRAYNKDYGKIEDYRDGYKQGFESGYDTGFAKQPFQAAVPANLAIRGVSRTEAVVAAPAVPDSSRAAIGETQAPMDPPPVVQTPKAGETANEPVPDTPKAAEAATEPMIASEDRTLETVNTPAPAELATPIRNASYSSDEVIVIPRDAELILELQDELSTDAAKEGDKFTARVISPAEVSGAIIEGRVEKIQKPGRIKRRSQMLLSFDRIVVSESRWSNFDAILTEILPVKGDNVRRVDAEGSAIGKSSLKSDSVKVGAATGTGAGIGAIAGGPVGAAVGAGVGAAIGVGAVAIEHGKHIKLNRSQQLRIKSSYETRIR